MSIFKNIFTSVIIGFVFFGCSDNSVSGVKNGILKAYSQSLTVGQAVDSWAKTQSCDKTNWESFETERGENIVQFTCMIDNQETLNSLGLRNGLQNTEDIYAKLEMENKSYENTKNELLKGLEKFEIELKDIEEQEKSIKIEHTKIKEEEKNTKLQLEIAKEEFNKKKEKIQKADSDYYGTAYNFHKKNIKEYEEIEKNLLSTIYSLNGRESEYNLKIQQINYKKRQVEYTIEQKKREVENEIASLDKSISDGYKDIERIESLSSAVYELKNINFIIQFTLTADKKEFAPSYEGIEYIFNDLKVYEKNISNNTKEILMNIALGFFGNSSILISAYQNKIYKIDFYSSYFDNRK